MPAFAQLFPIDTPTSAYTGATTPVPITAPDETLLSSISGGGQSITFSTAQTALTVGGVGGWGIWGSPPNTENSAPRVLATPSNQSSLTLTLAVPVNTFGFEIEPANSGGLPPTPFNITVTFFNGATPLGTVTRSIAFNSALLEAASSTTPITSVQITAPGGAGGWAMAQFRFGTLVVGAPSVPSIRPLTLAGIVLLLAAAGCSLHPVRTYWRGRV